MRGLTRKVGSRAVLDDVSFTAPAGRITGVLGSPGAGKSALVHLAVGLDRPDSGQVLLNGLPFEQHRTPARVAGAMLSTSTAYPYNTARRHLQTIATNLGLPRERVDEVAHDLGLHVTIENRVNQLSFGHRRRLALASALLADPDALILDDPTRGLETPDRLAVEQILRSFAEQGGSVLMTSRSRTEIGLADHILVLDNARIRPSWPSTKKAPGQATSAEVTADSATRNRRAARPSSATITSSSSPRPRDHRSPLPAAAPLRTASVTASRSPRPTSVSYSAPLKPAASPGSTDAPAFDPSPLEQLILTPSAATNASQHSNSDIEHRGGAWSRRARVTGPSLPLESFDNSSLPDPLREKVAA
ncbi:MAG: ATP-binding cassette domain-containing protein [Propionibacteriaceae bacterium]|nr:ATP-binding cassette domain-containing protein [Propionibacteriaceae bacterium]